MIIQCFVLVEDSDYKVCNHWICFHVFLLVDSLDLRLSRYIYRVIINANNEYSREELY